MRIFNQSTILEEDGISYALLAIKNGERTMYPLAVDEVPEELREMAKRNAKIAEWESNIGPKCKREDIFK